MIGSKSNWRSVARKAERLGQSEHAIQIKIETGEDRLTDERHDLDEIDDKIAEARTQVQRLQSEIAAHRNRIQFNQQREEEFSELIERYRGDIDAAEAKRTEQESQIHEADLLIEKTQRLLATKQDELAQWNEKASQLRAERGAREEQLTELQASISKLESKVSALEGELNGNNARREATAARIADLENAITAALQQRDEIAKKLSDARQFAPAGRRSFREICSPHGGGREAFADNRASSRGRAAASPRS